MNLLWLTDLKFPQILIRLLIPFIISVILVSLLSYSLFGVLPIIGSATQSPLLQDLQQWVQQTKTHLAGLPLIVEPLLWLLEISLKTIAGLLGLLIGSYLILLLTMIITSFMSGSLIKIIHQRHYPDIPYQGHGSTLSIAWEIIRFSGKMLLIAFLTLPILFIPLLNVIWFWLIGFLFFRFFILSDVGHIILSKPQYQQIKSLYYRPIALPLLYTLSFLPFLGFWIPVIAVIATAHYCFQIQSQSIEFKQ